MVEFLLSRVFEAVLIIMVTTASVFIAAVFLGTCVRKDTLADSSTFQGFVSLLT